MIIGFFCYFPLSVHLILSVYFDKKQELVIAARKKRQKANKLSNFQAWDDIGSNLDHHNVPQKATNTTIIFVGFVFIASNFYVWATEFTDETWISPLTSMYLSMLVLSICSTVHLPLVLIFTVNHIR